MQELVNEAFEHYEKNGVKPDHSEIVDYVSEAFQLEFGRELDSYDYSNMEFHIMGRVK